MKEDWTDRLRQRLEGHKAEPPAGLWEGISNQMGLEAKPDSKANASKRWYWAAAASVLALVGFFVYQSIDDRNFEQPLQKEIAKQSTVPQEPLVTSVVEKESPQKPQQTEKQQPQSKQRLLARAVKIEQVNDVKQDTSYINNVNEPVLPDKELSSVETDEVGTTEQQESQPTITILSKADNWDIDLSKAPTLQKWSVGLNASSGLLALQASERTDRVYFGSGIYNDAAGSKSDGIQTGIGEKGDTGLAGETNSAINEGMYMPFTNTRIETKHHLPVRFGLSVQYQLNDMLSLHSGINYSYLYSEFSIPLYQHISYAQKLHYLGIPVGLSWKMWSAGRFSFYVSGQAMLEKCLNDKPWQWSLGISAGAEYSIARQLGLYLEPSLGYFFDDGTSLEHYYKEHPLAPSIEFGLRLHINK